MSDQERAPLVTTDQLAHNWARQHEVYPDGHWVRTYWDSWERPHRGSILQALEHLGPIDSLLEVGSASGPNLRAIHRRWPRMALAGLDVNLEALTYGQGKAQEEGWTWSAIHGDLRGLRQITFPVADVLLACYTLAYVDPTQIDAHLQTLWEACRVGLVIAEPSMPEMDGETWVPPTSDGVPEYHHDFVKRSAKLQGPHKGMWITPVRPPEQRLNQIVTILK